MLYELLTFLLYFDGADFGEQQNLIIGVNQFDCKLAGFGRFSAKRRTVSCAKSVLHAIQNYVEITVEENVLKVGDSHNPDDPHFKYIKDSLLTKYNVKTTDELPINYGGFVMKEGKKISSKIYADHFEIT